MRGSFTGGTILGIPIRISPTWFIALALSTALLGARVFPSVLPRASVSTQWALALATTLAFFLSILLHELGHAIAARWFGIRVRNITLSLLGGAAQISQEVTRPLAEFLIAAAGPAVTLALALLALLLQQIAGDRHSPLGVMLTALWLMNLSVGIFNLVPGFPMDGGRLLRALLWALTGSFRLATRIAGWTGRAVAVGLMVIGVASLVHVANSPLRSDPISGVWLLVVGIYLDGAARQSLELIGVLDHLRRFRVGDLMLRSVPLIAGDAHLIDFLPRLLATPDCDAAFVYAPAGEDEPRQIVGLLSRGTAITVPRQQRAAATAFGLMLPADSIDPAAPDDDAATILQRLEGEELPALPVVAAGEVVGLLGRSGLLRGLDHRARS